MRRLIAVAPLLALGVLTAAFVLMLSRGGGQQTFDKERLLGKPAPQFMLPTSDGATVSSETLAGKPYVVNFFASWCVPCRAEHPVLVAMARQGVPIIGIDYKDKPEEMQKMLDQLGDPFAAIGLDPTGETGLDFGITGVPETIVVGADGRVRALHRQPLDAAAVSEKILPALKGATPVR